MVDQLDDLVLLLLRCDGKQAAIRTYEEETGASHARAVWAVEGIAHRYGVAMARPWTTWRTAAVIMAVSAISLLLWISSGYF